MKSHQKHIVQECRFRLVKLKADLLNRVRNSTSEFQNSLGTRSSSGDEIDQTVAQLEENNFLISQERMRMQLLEIEMAFARMENGTFGLCEETEELIEVERLLAVPWTRYSIEGAEIREALEKKYAR